MIQFFEARGAITGLIPGKTIEGARREMLRVLTLDHMDGAAARALMENTTIKERPIPIEDLADLHSQYTLTARPGVSKDETSLSDRVLYGMCGRDVERILGSDNRRNVWSVVYADQFHNLVKPGFHVPRIGFLLTTKPWSDNDRHRVFAFLSARDITT